MRRPLEQPASANQFVVYYVISKWRASLLRKCRKPDCHWFSRRFALDSIVGWSRSERKSCVPMSLTSSSSSRDRSRYRGIWRRSINFFKGWSFLYGDAIYRRVLLFACRLNHIPPYLFPSREDDDDVRDIGKQFLFDSTSPYRIFWIFKALY